MWLALHVYTNVPDFLHGFWESKLGPPACKANTLLIELPAHMFCLAWLGLVVFRQSLTVQAVLELLNLLPPSLKY